MGGLTHPPPPAHPPRPHRRPGPESPARGGPAGPAQAGPGRALALDSESRLRYIEDDDEHVTVAKPFDQQPLNNIFAVAHAHSMNAFTFIGVGTSTIKWDVENFATGSKQR